MSTMYTYITYKIVFLLGEVYEIQTKHLKSSETKYDQVSFLRGHSSSKSILTSQTVSKTHQQSRNTNQLLGYGQ